MSRTNHHPARRTAAGMLASTLAVSGLLASASPAQAASGFMLERIAGDNRYETSARIAEVFGPATGVILASGERGRSVDALSANFLAGVRGVPVLLTERDRVPATVQTRLNALTGPRNVTIVGGTVAVSAAVENSLRAQGFTVTRLSGADRYTTSRAIINAGRASANAVGLVASGTNFPDALAGGPLSYKGKHPIFLSAGGRLPQATVDAMVAAGTRQVIVLGGLAAVPATVEAQLRARNITVVTRLGGADRSETSTRIADYMMASAGFTGTTFNLAAGINEGVDALSGAALSARQNRVLLITNTASSAAPVIAEARARAATLTAVGNVFGGPAVVTIALELAVEAAGAGVARAVVTVPTTAVTAGQAVTGSVAGTGIQSVTVSGPCVSGPVTLTDTDSTAAGLQFSVPTLSTTPAGSCVLTFTTTFTDGSTAVAGSTVSIAAPQAAAPPTTPPAEPPPAEPPPATATVTVGVTPAEPASRTAVVGDTAPNDPSDDRSYSVATTAAAGVTHRIVLVPAANVTVRAGTVTFAEEGTSGVAALGTVAARIISVNGAPVTPGQSLSAIPVNGVITFTVDGEADEAVVPVVFIDADGDGLDLQADGTPVDAEPFGIGGTTTYTVPPAPTPAAITVRDAVATFTTVTWTVDGAAPGATVVTYCGPDDGVDTFDPATDAEAGRSATDQDAGTAGFQAVASGLTPETNYDCFLTQVVDGQESAPTGVENVFTAPPPNQSFAVTPDGAATSTAVVGDEPNVTTDDVEYTVATALAGEAHRIVLIPAANVTVRAGTVTFAEEGTSGVAALGTVAARIISVNGAPVTPGQSLSAIPVNGVITFTVDGEADEAVVPVVFIDTDGDGLDLQADGTPVAAEPFGIGGTTTYSTTAPQPAAVTVRDAVATFTTVTWTVDGAAPGATVVTYCGPDDGVDTFDPATDAEAGRSATDQDAGTAGFQAVASGLTPETNYDCFLTQVVDGQESAPTGVQNVFTAPPPA